MKNRTRLKLIKRIALAALLLSAVNYHALTWAQGTAFTYQGRLNDGASAANGFYDLRFTLFDSTNAGTAIGLIVTNTASPVSNGLFTASLDFGPNAFNGDARWLEIAVRTNGLANSFTPLTPRQPLTPAPYAIRASAVDAAGIQGAISDSALSANIPRLNGSGQVFTGAVAFSNAANQFAGNFSGNGSGLVGLNASNLSTGAVSDLRLSSNVALLNRSNQIFAGTNSFSSRLGIGTPTPATDLEIVTLSSAGPSLRLTGHGGAGTKATLDLTTYDPGSNAPAARIQTTENNWSSDLDIMTKQPGANANALVSRLRISAGGNVGIGTTTPDRPLTVGGTGVNGEWASLRGTNGLTAWHLNNLSGGLNFAQSGVADNRLFISTNGNVGIGTSSPVSKLSVVGDIRLGGTAELLAPGALESLRIVQGIVGADGTVVTGAGYTATRLGLGHYSLTFTPGFQDLPTVNVTPINGSAIFGIVNLLNSTTAQIAFFDAAGAASEPSYFNFTAIGAR